MRVSVSRYATWRHVLVAALLAGVLAWVVVAVVGQQFAAATNGLKPFDLQPGLRSADIPAQLPAYTPESVRIYLRFFFLDFFLPLFAYGTLVLLWARLQAGAFPAWHARYGWSALLPCVPMACDWGENLAFLSLILAWPRHWHWLGELAVGLHRGKFAGMMASNAVILFLAAAAARAAVTDRFSRS
jgi:hypothetical protein